MFQITKLRLQTTIGRLAIVIGGASIFSAPFLSPRVAVLAFVGTVPWLYFILSCEPKSLVALTWFLVMVYVVGVIGLSWLGSFSYPAWFVSPLFYVPLFLPTFYLTRWLR